MLDSASDGLTTVTQRYTPDSNLDAGPEFRHSGTLLMSTTRTYDAAGRLQSTASGVPVAVPHSGAAYEFDAASRRSAATHPDGSAWDFDYNDRGELIDSARHWPTGLPVSGQQFAQSYDGLGNLLATTDNTHSASYTPNALNQYSERSVPPAIDVIGSAAPAANVTVNQEPARRDQGGYFYASVPASNSAAPLWLDLRILAVQNHAGPGGADLVSEQTGRRFLPQSPEVFVHDDDGNLTRDGRWDYTWDAENRLIQMETRRGM